MLRTGAVFLRRFLSRLGDDVKPLSISRGHGSKDHQVQFGVRTNEGQHLRPDVQRRRRRRRHRRSQRLRRLRTNVRVRVKVLLAWLLGERPRESNRESMRESSNRVNIPHFSVIL